MAHRLNAATLATSLSLLLAGASAGPATAQDRDPIEPRSGSPSGYVYEIPLEGARRDAAPRKTRGGRGDGGTGSSGSSGTTGASGSDDRAVIQSDNGFGSSSSVPGAEGASGAGGSGSGSASGGSGDEGAAAGGGSGGGSGSGSGAGATATPAADRLDETDAADTDRIRTSSLVGGSDGAVTPLIVLGLAVVVGGGLALVSRRRPGA